MACNPKKGDTVRVTGGLYTGRVGTIVDVYANGGYVDIRITDNGKRFVAEGVPWEYITKVR